MSNTRLLFILMEFVILEIDGVITDCKFTNEVLFIFMDPLDVNVFIEFTDKLP